MLRSYYHFEVWEDYMNGMYETLTGKERNIMLNKAITLASDSKLFGEWMLKVVNDWPLCCAQNLTDQHTNQRAWIGQAAICMALKCPEDLTRIAWGCISKQQQEEANAQADIAIEEWNEKQNNGLHSKVGKAGLSKRHSRRSPAEVGSYVQSSLLPNDLQGHT
jgi:hypothetical protein